MMVAMMLPSVVPQLWRYRNAIARTGETHVDRLTAVAGAGYFAVWTAFGLIAFPVGAALAALAMQQPALARGVPLAGGVVILMAGALQFTQWKARHLTCIREVPVGSRASPRDANDAWRYGARLGVLCARCCANLMAILLVAGVMNLRAMTVVTAAITAERLTPAGEGAARAVGTAVLAAGMILLARGAVGSWSG
jgi:predicted metal-binding membrane protein